MIVLRKEVKMGLGIAAAALGIALVYGIMATLSANSRTPGVAAAPTDDAAQTTTDAGLSTPPAGGGAVAGLPPVDDKGVAKTPVHSADPFAESARSDGNKNDPWEAALATGKLPAVNGMTSDKPAQLAAAASSQTLPASDSSSHADAPTAASQADSSGPIVTQVPEGFTAVADNDKTKSHAAPARENSDAPGAAGGTSAKGDTYVVQSGDTFTRIATKLYGDRRLVAALIKANPTIEPSRLRVGVAINVPAKNEIVSVRGGLPAAKSTVMGAVDVDKEYRVVAGDSLHRIAAKLYQHAGMWEAIYDENKGAIGDDPAKIKVGQVLKLPKPPTHTA